MNLKTYEQKRDFAITPEPKAQVEKENFSYPIFVIQKHQAAHLHFDLRLESEGVLKSWAVPKGLPENKEKHLAVETEDHPYDYAYFEGVIPQGEYGAGTVEIYDRAWFLPKDISLGLKKGHVDVFFLGEKVNGSYTLIRTKNSKNWLIFKNSNLPKEHGNNKMPANFKPMLATLIDQPFNKDNWLFEVKWDGYRILAQKAKDKILLSSRNLLNFNDKFPEIRKELESIDHDFLIDGEAVIVDKFGKPVFNWLQNYPKEKNGQLYYYVFDLLYLDGFDLTKEPLLKRKIMLKELLSDHILVKYSNHILKDGQLFFEQIKKNDLEGMLAKEIFSPYYFGQRVKFWQKIKTHKRQEFIIVGFTPPSGGRKFFGSILLGVQTEEGLKYVGNAGTGFNEKTLAETKELMQENTSDQIPVYNPPKLKNITWLKPKLVAEVKFAEWTKEDLLRQAVFLGLREDKSPRTIIKEEPKRSGTIKKLKFTNLNKIFWPSLGITKGEMVSYYASVSHLMLPFLKDRPLSMKRYPNGISGEGWYQKDAGPYIPKWINTFKIRHETESRLVNYILCQNEETLLYLANLAVIEFHPWISKIQNLEKPDVLIIDLDPLEISFKEVVKAAQTLHQILKKAGIGAFCKTSGSKGLHILIPTKTFYSYEIIKQFAELVVTIAHQYLPNTTSLLRNPEKREGCVYLDFLQNNFGQTIAAPYTLRARKEATISTPLFWDEVDERLDPKNFNLRNFSKRKKNYHNPWEDFFSSPLKIEDGIQGLKNRL